MRRHLLEISLTLVCGNCLGCQLQEWEHRPLQDNRKIRHFRLHRWIPFFGVRGSLCIVSLNNVLPYEAILYHWGIVPVKRRIYIDGSPFAVLPATYDALRGRSSLWRTRMVWIDCIYIDQSNLDEKPIQIPLMKDINSRASRVVVWLGSAPLSELVFSLFHELTLLIKQSGLSGTELYKKFELRRRNFRWPAFVEFLNHPWFARVWIVQEVAVAKNVQVIIGGRYYDWDVLEEVFKIFASPEMAAFLQLTQDGRNAVRSLHHLGTLAEIREPRPCLRPSRSWMSLSSSILC